MQTTEEINDCTKSLFYFKISHTLQANSQFSVRELSHVSWSERLLIHELLERVVSCLLESHLVRETLADHLINLKLELEQLLSELYRAFDKSLIFYNLFAPLHDIRVHLHDN